jgi:hypothetical protein
VVSIRGPVAACLLLTGLITSCSAPVPPAVCEARTATPQPDSGEVRCAEAVAAATAALPANHLPIAGIRFSLGMMCPPDSGCPFTPFVGVVWFTFRTPIDDRTTDAYVQVGKEQDGKIIVITPLTPLPYDPSLVAD